MKTSFPITVLSRIWLNEEAFELTCSRPAGFSFHAGQYVALEFQGEVREYTLLSPPDAQELRFLIKQVVGGKLSAVLGKIDLGSVLLMGKARGYLTYHPTARSIYFVATGVGIAPFVAMAAGGLQGFTLIHGARTESGLFYQREMAALSLQYISCISGTNIFGAGSPTPYHGYVTEYIRTYLQPGQYDFYLCGSRAMIRDMTHLLDQHHPRTRIFSEAYS